MTRRSIPPLIVLSALALGCAKDEPEPKSPEDVREEIGEAIDAIGDDERDTKEEAREALDAGKDYVDDRIEEMKEEKEDK